MRKFPQLVNDVFPVVTFAEIATARRLFELYAASLAIDLGFQDFERELNTLPGDYVPPRGVLFLARANGSTAGCIGLRQFSESVGELKRLYVMPGFRGRGLARSLVAAAIKAAMSIGYTTLVLDTLASMHSAIGLYEPIGFVRTEAYYANPLPDAIYFRMELGSEEMK